jgi:hypothetical protein
MENFFFFGFFEVEGLCDQDTSLLIVPMVPKQPTGHASFDTSGRNMVLKSLKTIAKMRFFAFRRGGKNRSSGRASPRLVKMLPMGSLTLM